MSTSSALTQVVNTGVTTTNVTSSLNPAGFGASVTFTATVSPSVPDGETITFLDGGTSIGTGTTGSGSATLTTSTLIVGSHSITASYPGDANFAASTSSVLTQTIVQPTTTTLASSLNPSTFGASVTFTATITPSVPDGEIVTFYDGAASIGTGTTASGAATCNTSTLATGSHNITANYPGDASNASSTSSVLVQTVNQAASTTTVTSSLNPTTYGGNVTFTATIVPAVPDGETVTFYNGGSSIGTGTTSAGTATFATTTLSAPNDSITATYAGDTNYLTSTSSALTQVVNQAATTTTIASSLNPSVTGTAVTFTATIIPAVPNGETVTFYKGGVSIGTGATVSGSAAYTTSTLPSGNLSIWATYGGDTNYLTSTSSTLNQDVLIKTTTTVTSSGNPSADGASVTFTATIAPATPNGEIVTFYDGGVSIGTGTVAGGKATLTTSTLAPGIHSMTAKYPGDATYANSLSNVFSQTVNHIPTTTTLVSSVNPSISGAPVTFTATITPTVPNGEIVTFYDGAFSIGAPTTSAGVATLTTSTLAAGPHNITAKYAGDAIYATSTSSVVVQTVNKRATTTLTYSTLNPSAVGMYVSFEAAVVPAPPNNEIVTFYDGVTNIGTGTTYNGYATFTTPALIAGSHNITAKYPGDATFVASTSPVTTQVVLQLATTTLASSLNPSTVGAAVKFTATIGAAVPDGETVTFYNGSTSIGTGLTSGAKATLTTSALPAGVQSITAAYAGDATYGASTSSPLLQTVNKVATATSVASSSNPSAFGAAVTFTATVSPSVTNGDTVTFLLGGNTIGTGTTSGGKATLTTTALATGSNIVSASFGGDAIYGPSTSSTITQTVTKSATTMSLASSLNPSAFGASVTLTATISPSIPNGETLSFYNGGILMGTGTTSGGKATLTTNALATGSYSILASYAGDANFGASKSSTITQTVGKSGTTITLASSPSTSSFGVAVTFTATIAPSVPGGEIVTFYDGSTSIGTGTISAGKATLVSSTLSAGSHSITAKYAGDANFGASTSNAVTQTVNKIATTTALASSQNPSTYAASVTFTATLSPAVTNGITVTFSDGSVTIGTGITSGGKATLTTSTLALGSHSIKASYPGDANYVGSTSSVLTLTINKGTVSTTLTSSLNASTYTAAVTFTATIAPSVPNGETVTFYDGSMAIGLPATTSGGKASLTITTLAVGTHSITAKYAGDSTYGAGTSSALTQTVLVGRPATSVVSSLNPSTYGASVTFTATISMSVPNGEIVTFYQGASSKAAIGTGSIINGVATLRTAVLPAGADTVWAYYPGDANFAYSWSSGLAQTVNKAATTTTLTSSLNPSAHGTSVTFTATLNPAVPSGETVTFYDGATSIGTAKASGGKATLATTALATGTHSITASYPGDANYATSTSSAVTQTVN